MKNQPWIDILPPTAPAEPLAWWLWIVVAGSIIAIFASIYLWRHTPKQQALRKLKSIHHGLNETSELKKTALEISLVLKNRFKVKSIGEINIEADPGWITYRQQLTRLCFSKNPVEQKDVIELIRKTRFWIKQQDRHHD